MTFIYYFMRIKNYHHVFPYDLLHKQKWVHKERNSILEANTTKILGDDLFPGLRFGYQQMLEAIEDKDTEYLSRVMERRLAKRFIHYFNEHDQ